MDKESLRKVLIKKREALSDKQVAEFSQKIINNCWRVIDWAQVLSVHSFLPIAKNHEIDTLPLLKVGWQLNPNLKIATTQPLPQAPKGLSFKDRPFGGKSEYRTCWLDSDFQVSKKAPENFQYGLIIVPMLGFDESGHRLGYGSGFYDRFLASQLQALTIGLCYEASHLKKLPSETHDISLKNIVTESAIYKF